MRPVSPHCAAAIVRGTRVRLRVSSWLGPLLLADRLPVVAGSWRLEQDITQRQPDKLTFQVPRERRWEALADPVHPLATLGQRLRTVFDVGGEMVAGPQFRLSSVEPDDDVLTVTGEGLLSILDRSRLLETWRSDGLTCAQAMIQLVDGALPLSILAGDDDAKSMEVEQDRLQGILDLADSWPAVVRVSDTGVVTVTGPLDDGAVSSATLTTGTAGHLLEAKDTTSTAVGYNGWRVSTVPEGDAQPVSEVVVITDGPMRWDGPYGRVPGFYSSPLLPPRRTRLRQVGQQLLERSRRRTDGCTWSTLPDPRIQPDDIVRIVFRGRDRRARVTAVTHTATATSGTGGWL